LLRCADFVVMGNTFKGSSLPVTVPYSIHGRIARNSIKGWGWYGIEVPHTASNVTVTGNTLRDTDPRAPAHHSSQAISITDAATHVTIARNTIHQSAGSPAPTIIIGGGSPGGASVNNVMITGNTFRKSGRNGCVHIAGSPHVAITGNLFD
jgi:Right handed beta helix region